ncbi:MAG: type I restriction enzyme HsdR N-terminal domain-containing protein [Zoogloeaceae bacterium]|jgi:hypothetical protein|nr:type I restriction enzyme HsdR N-terminal domain-containing protein [Zoogloeaceae bacterium]
MQAFIERLRRHAEHIDNVGNHCTTEETTKQALILPLLDRLGFSPFDPMRVKAEYGADFPGVKANERVDYALFCQGVPVMFIEAKAWAEKPSNHAPQLSRYFNATPEVAVAAITNGREWRFFTDLHNKNVMDSEPFLTIDFSTLDESQVTRLYRFRHDEFQPDALRTLAEESIYLNAFTDVISNSLREPDTEFVRYVATRANVQRQFNAKFLESIAPIVQQAVGRAVSNMVVTGLSAKPAPAQEAPPVAATQPHPADDKGDWIDPENPKIITTFAERKLLEVTRSLLGNEVEISGKDTESYYAILYKGKVNRWLLRYYGVEHRPNGRDRSLPLAQFCVPMTSERKKEIARAGLSLGMDDAVILTHPDDLLRIAGILFDALAFCGDDSNFKRAKGEAESAPTAK